MALRQGPVRVPVPRRARAGHHAADPRPRIGAGVVRRGAHRDRGVVRGQARRVPHRRSADGRGLLRALQARTHRLRYERPGSPPRRRRRVRRGDDRVAGLPHGRRDLRRRGAGEGHPGRGARCRARGPDPAPAIAEGRPARREDLRPSSPADPAARCRRAHPVPAGRGAGRRLAPTDGYQGSAGRGGSRWIGDRRTAPGRLRQPRLGRRGDRRVGRRAVRLRHPSRERPWRARGRCPSIALAGGSRVRPRGGAGGGGVGVGADHRRRRGAQLVGHPRGVRRSGRRRVVPDRRRSASRLPRRRPGDASAPERRAHGRAVARAGHPRAVRRRVPPGGGVPGEGGARHHVGRAQPADPSDPWRGRHRTSGLGDLREPRVGCRRRPGIRDARRAPRGDGQAAGSASLARTGDRRHRTERAADPGGLAAPLHVPPAGRRGPTVRARR